MTVYCAAWLRSPISSTQVLLACSSSYQEDDGMSDKEPKPSVAKHSFLNSAKPQSGDDLADERPQERGFPCMTGMLSALKDLCDRTEQDCCREAASLVFLHDIPRLRLAASYEIPEWILHCLRVDKNPSKATCCAALARQERTRRTCGIYDRLGLMRARSFWPTCLCRAASNIFEQAKIPAYPVGIERIFGIGSLS